MGPILRRQKLVIFPVVIILITLFYFVSQNRYQLQNTISYATRPLWDKAGGPKNVIPHYYAEGLPFNSQTCDLHGWQERKGKPIVVDSVLMSSELDLLEIRMNELDSVVDYFFIVESNGTFTGLPKPAYFQLNRERFAKFEKKIVYDFLPGRTLHARETAWSIEAETRNAMTRLLTDKIATFPPSTQTIVIMSDVDEIPAATTISLLKACDFGGSIHLQLKNYLYSFEWFLDRTSWRASAHLWNPSGTIYRHSQSTDLILADAGWHCSYCFRTIGEYSAKMQGFSHHDRIGGDLSLLKPERIQAVICKGKDIFGMLPEAYSYLDMLSQMSLVPQTTAVGLPLYLLENKSKFKFLLPGGCER